MQKRKVPMRKCIASGEMKPKKDLVRIVRNKEGEVSIDPSGKKNGRGAYICNSVECLEKAIKNRGLEKSFKTAISKDIYEKLKEELK